MRECKTLKLFVDVVLDYRCSSYEIGVEGANVKIICRYPMGSW